MARVVTAKNIKTTSWRDGKYDLFFYGIVRGLRPKRCVELGTYAGYSAYCIALGLKHNGVGQLDCYDLWENYKFNHVDRSEAQDNLRWLPVNLLQENALTAHAHYKFESVDLLMVDLSNDGIIYKMILDRWYPYLSKDSIVLMEGGSTERDKVDWMIEYKKTPINEMLKHHSITDRFKFDVLVSFPGITIFTKK